MPHLLKACTVAEARWYFRNKIPIIYRNDQLSNGLDEDGKIPTVESLAIENFNAIFIPDGNLTWNNLKDKTKGQISGWLNSDNPGPYTSTASNLTIFYLSGQRAEINKGHPLVYEESCLQICSDPFNILSEDCVDEIHVMIPFTS